MNKVQLPSLNDQVAVEATQIEAFRKNGHTLTKSILQDGEIGAYRDVINEAAYHYNTEKRKLEDRDTYGKAFLQIMNLWQVDEHVKKFTLAKRFAKIAASLLGVDNVRIYH